MREACKFNVQIHNGNILMSSVTKDPGVSSILLFSSSSINFPRPLVKYHTIINKKTIKLKRYTVVDPVCMKQVDRRPQLGLDDVLGGN
jgi:hypothetical protein